MKFEYLLNSNDAQLNNYRTSRETVVISMNTRLNLICPADLILQHNQT